MNDAVTSLMARARTELDAAGVLAREGFPDQATSRAYYAAFFAAEAALLSLGETRSKHSGVIATFGRLVVKEGGFAPATARGSTRRAGTRCRLWRWRAPSSMRSPVGSPIDKREHPAAKPRRCRRSPAGDHRARPPRPPATPWGRRRHGDADLHRPSPCAGTGWRASIQGHLGLSPPGPSRPAT